MNQELLNLSTLKQLAHVEAQVPHLLDSQLRGIEDKWEIYIGDLKIFTQENALLPTAALLHKIKGHAGMIGLRGISDFCQKLELTVKTGKILSQEDLLALTDIKNKSIAAARQFKQQEFHLL